MPNSPKISIIVPIYNVDKYLNYCIQSVIEQQYENWELILVNDGSTDNSLNICQSYASHDSRIIVIDKNNSGVSDSRNCALDNVSGKYVLFLDADDYWYHSTFLCQLVNLAEDNKLDIVRGEYKAVDVDGKDMFCRKIARFRMKYANKILDSGDFLKYAIHGEFFLWLTLLNRKKIANLRFTKGRSYLEDMEFYVKLCMQPLRCMYVPNIRFYAYRKHAASVSYEVSEKKLMDLYSISDQFYQFSYLVQDKMVKRYFQKQCVQKYFELLDILATKEYMTVSYHYITLSQLESKRRQLLKVAFNGNLWPKHILLHLHTKKIVTLCKVKAVYISVRYWFYRYIYCELMGK